jgi:hypothetical protein
MHIYIDIYTFTNTLQFILFYVRQEARVILGGGERLFGVAPAPAQQHQEPEQPRILLREAGAVPEGRRRLLAGVALLLYVCPRVAVLLYMCPRI